MWMTCWSSGVTRPRLPLGVTHREATLVQALVDDSGGDIHPCGDPNQRPPWLQEPDRFLDLLLGQTAAAHRNAVASGDRRAPRCPRDATRSELTVALTSRRRLRNLE